MAYDYHKSEEVLSPRAYVSDVRVIYDSDQKDGPQKYESGYSIARLKWDGDEVIGIRWNINQHEWENKEKAAGTKKCLGQPSSRGFATWYIIPNEFLGKLLGTEYDQLADRIEKLLLDKKSA